MFVDMHVHSNHSFDSKINLEDLLKKLKEINLDGIIITDHDSIEATAKAKEIAKKLEVKVFAGVEITTKLGHVLAYGIEEKPIYRKSVEETIEWVRERNGITICAHPFRRASLSLGENVYNYNFDALEINANCNIAQNRATELAADLMNIPLVGGSDAHFLHNVGTISTYFYDEINNEDELVSAIKKRQCEVHYQTPISIKAELIKPMPLSELERTMIVEEDIVKTIVPSNKPIGQEARFFDIEGKKDT
ncbi:MAG: PHP domain-containing protein [Candidatus Heimdallarchaeota archaeon]|nr:PHP domain-containing protein [Candidatus Heimdallarchaeota archaeon]